jgi:hypothetical protein
MVVVVALGKPDSPEILLAEGMVVMVPFPQYLVQA